MDRHRRLNEVSAVIGDGDELWARASADLLRWKVKTRSGFAVDDAGPVTSGARPIITVRLCGWAIHEPVEVTEVIDEPARVGFTCRTLPGHPVDGVETFLLTRDADGIVLTVRSESGASDGQPWRTLHPVIRIAQRIAHRRYLRALR